MRNTLKKHNLYSQTKRRFSFNLIAVFNIILGFTKVNSYDNFTAVCSNITGNNAFKIFGKHFETNEVKLFFFNRVLHTWNGLPSKVVNLGTAEPFRRRLNNYFKLNSG